MRKIIYILALIISILGIVSMFFIPIFKLSDDKISGNYEEYAALISDSTYHTATLDSSCSSLNKEAKKKLSDSLIEYRTYVHSVIVNDEKYYGEYVKVDIINLIYQETYSTTDRPLSNSSTADEIKHIEDDLITKLGENNYQELKINKTKEDLKNKRSELFKLILDTNGVDSSTLNEEELAKEAERLSINGTKYLLLDDFFLYFVLEHSDLYIDLMVEEATNKGITVSKIFSTTIANMKKINKAVFEAKGENISIFERLTKEVKNEEDLLYNPLPILFIVGLMILVIIIFIRFIFAGIKGIKGHKRPNTLISSILLLAISLFLKLGYLFINQNTYYAYHSSKVYELLEVIRFTDSPLSLVLLIISIVLFILTIIGSLFKWKGKNNN